MSAPAKDPDLYAAWSSGLLEGVRCAGRRAPCVNRFLRPGAAPSESKQLEMAREWERGYWEGFDRYRREKESLKPALDAARARGFLDGRKDPESDAGRYLSELKSKEGLSEEHEYNHAAEIESAWQEGHAGGILARADRASAGFWMGAFGGAALATIAFWLT